MGLRYIDSGARNIIHSTLNNRMVLSKHVKHYRRGISLTRRLTDSATGRDTVENVQTMAQKISRSGILNQSRITMQNQWKTLAQLKDAMMKSEQNKNFQLLLQKCWIGVSQKIFYPSFPSTRKFSAGKRESTENEEGLLSAETKSADTTVKIQLPEKSEIAVGSGNNEKKLEVQTSLVSPDQFMQSTKDQILALPQVLNEFFGKLSPRGQPNVAVATVPKWKSSIKTNVTKHSIVSRTKHVLSSIVTAESNVSQMRRLDDLLSHLEQYPEARHYALKEGAVTILLRTRQRCKDDEVQASIREALAALGHVDPVPRQGIRILSIDGGGMRGLLVIEMLKKLEALTGQRVHEMFDFMCGVSTGAILSANLGSRNRRSLNTISELYKELSTKIFNQSAIRGTSSLVWSHAYYNTSLWEEMLKEQFGEEDLIKTARNPISPKFSVIATTFDNAQVMAYIFRNYTLPPRVESQYMGSHRHKLWEAVRASAAAPTYFEEFKHGEYILSDGGIMVNNPCAVAIHEAKLLWPNTPIQCVMSFGTGRTPPSIPSADGETKDTGASSWKDKFYKILASATDTEGVHTMLNDLLPDHVYYRFNPYLTEMVSMDDVRPEKWALLEQDAQMYIRKNEEKFSQAALALSQKKTTTQKIVDEFKLQKQLLGFN